MRFTIHPKGLYLRQVIQTWNRQSGDGPGWPMTLAFQANDPGSNPGHRTIPFIEQLIPFFQSKRF